MKTIKLLLMSVLGLVFAGSFCEAGQNKPQLFVVIDVDHVLLDRIDPDNTLLADQLARQGFSVQYLEFDIEQKENPRFFELYKARAGTDISHYFSKMRVSRVSENKLHIKECVVIRPGIVNLLEGLQKMDFPLRLLVTSSQREDEFTQHFVDHFNLSLNGKSFKESVELLPRWVLAANAGGSHGGQKSAEQLRKNYVGKYAPISNLDYVVFIDRQPAGRGETGRNLQLYLTDFDVNSVHLYSTEPEPSSGLKRGLEQINSFFSGEENAPEQKY